MRIGVTGVAGRMGQALVREVTLTDGVTLSAALEHPDSPVIGADATEGLAGLAPSGILIGGDARAFVDACDAVIDFTRPDATLSLAKLTAATQTIHVIGTTGFTETQERTLADAARHTVLVKAPNMSLAVNLLMHLTEKVAGVLDAAYDIEIVEMHHRHKVDAPSGTALGLGQAAAAGRGVALENVWCKTRDGHTGERPAGEIGFATLRGGDVVGDHTVVFAGSGERLELTHKASDRRIYARGAVHCAVWAQGKAAGCYGMRDVLGLA